MTTAQEQNQLLDEEIELLNNHQFHRLSKTSLAFPYISNVNVSILNIGLIGMTNSGNENMYDMLNIKSYDYF